MKKWRNALLGMAVVTMLGTTLAGCGGGGGGTNTSNSGEDAQAGLAAESGKKLTIMLPGHNPKKKGDHTNEVVEQYKAQYPEVTVEFVVGSWENWETKVLAAAQSGDPIDVINDGANNNPKFALKGVTQPLQKYINMDNPNLDKISMDAVFKYGDDYFVAAAGTNVAVIFYNKTIFANNGLQDPMEMYKAGEWTWGELCPDREVTDE